RHHGHPQQARWRRYARVAKRAISSSGTVQKGPPAATTRAAKVGGQQGRDDLGTIRTIYVCNHTHTDIGFTDYQDVAFRQHGEFIRQALDLIEATDGFSPEAQYKWTCETTGPLMRYLRGASQAEVDRFKHWHQAGRIDVAAMQYNLTPLLNVEKMH